MQKLTLIGRVGSDPELKTTPNGISVCSFSVAASGQKKDQTTWYKANAWRQLGEACYKFLSKGKLVYIEGELQPRTYQAKSGETKMSLDVQVSEIEFLSPKSEERSDAAESGIDASGFETISSDSIPF
jgi:single-strand DNA-binding protein